jgi:dolichol kinase
MDELKRLKKNERENLRNSVINAFRSEFITLAMILLLIAAVLFSHDEVVMSILAFSLAVSTVLKIVGAHRAEDKRPR